MRVLLLTITYDIMFREFIDGDSFQYEPSINSSPLYTQEIDGYKDINLEILIDDEYTPCNNMEHLT